MSCFSVNFFTTSHYNQTHSIANGLFGLMEKRMKKKYDNF